MKSIGLVCLALSVAACHDEPPVRPVGAWAAGVRVEHGEPPPGARLLGEVVASDGEGCGIGGDRGSLRNALSALQEAAARKGATFVKLTEVTKPYSGRDCVHQEFKLRGLAYALAGTTPSPAVTLSAAPAAPSVCAPPCSPGYACSVAGVCLAQCNPACAPQEICRADRVCVPVAP